MYSLTEPLGEECLSRYIKCGKQSHQQKKQVGIILMVANESDVVSIEYLDVNGTTTLDLAQVAPAPNGGMNINPASPIRKTEIHLRQIEHILDGDLDRDAIVAPP